MPVRLLPHYFVSHTGSTRAPRQLVATATSTVNMARSHIGHVHFKLGCTVVVTSDTHKNLMSERVCWLVHTKTLPPTLRAQGCHANLWPLPHPLQAQPLPHRALRAQIWLCIAHFINLWMGYCSYSAVRNALLYCTNSAQLVSSCGGR